MDVWRLELHTDDGSDPVIADRVLRSIGVDVGWTDRQLADEDVVVAVVAGVDLGFRVDPPAVVRTLADAGLRVRGLRRLPAPETDRAVTPRRIA